MTVWFALIAAVVGGWMVQLYLTYQQTASFNAQIVRLRRRGKVTVGVGGRRYRGGRAFVAMSVGDDGVVTDAITLQGFTTFARGRELRALRGQRIRRLSGERDVPGVTRQQREAARQAATLLLEARTTTPATKPAAPSTAAAEREASRTPT